MKVISSWQQVPNVKNNDKDASYSRSYEDDISVPQDVLILQQLQALTPLARAMLTPFLPAQVNLLMYSFFLSGWETVQGEWESEVPKDGFWRSSAPSHSRTSHQEEEQSAELGSSIQSSEGECKISELNLTTCRNRAGSRQQTNLSFLKGIMCRYLDIMAKLANLNSSLKMIWTFVSSSQLPR